MIPLIGLAASAVAGLIAPAAKPTATPTAAHPANAAQLAKIKKTSQQFEAIFVRQMLAAARKAHFGDTVTSGQGMDSFREMQDGQFADIASKQGAFGLAKLIEARLTHQAGLAAKTGGGS
jgi:flagellar protein FlgJ